MCETCRAIPKEHRAKAGYDLRLVPAVECLFCKKPIGAEPYVEVTILARFGQMSFAHRRCDEKATAKDDRTTDHWVKRQNQLGRAIDNRARTRAVTDATREAITRKARSRWKRLARAGPHPKTPRIRTR